MTLEQDTAAANAVASDDAFSAAFTGTEPQKPDTQTAVTETPPADEKEAPDYVQLTRQELADLKAAAAKTASYDKQFSTVFGTVGRFEQIVKEMQSQPRRNGKIEISKEAFADLEKDFPELANSTRAALEKALSGVSGTGNGEAEDIAERVGKAISAHEMKKFEGEVAALESAHPTWRQLIGAVAVGETPDPENPFRKWLATKNEDYQELVGEARTANVIARAIARFQRETKVSDKTPPQAARADAKREQIAGAAQARGDGGAPPTTSNSVDDAFAAGFKKG